MDHLKYTDANVTMSRRSPSESRTGRTPWLVRAAIAFVATFAMVSAGTVAANAAPVANTAAQSLISAKTVTNSDCVNQITKALKAGATGITTAVCTSTVTLKVSTPSAVTPTDLVRARNTMSAGAYSKLATSAAAGAAWSMNYSQSMNNGTDGETQYGTFYYDYSRAWVTVTYLGYTGTHFCKVDWAVGYAVNLVGCTESGTTAQRDLHAQWHFSVFFNGFPVSWDEVYTLHVDSWGTIWQ